MLNIKGVPAEAADRFRALATAEDCTQAEALTALVDMYAAGSRLDALEAQVAALEARREQAKRETAQAITDREQARKDAAALREAATDETARQVELSRAAVDLLRSLVEMGASRDAVLRWGQALAAADIEPEQAARVMERVGGLLRWAEQLQVGSEQLEAMRDKAQQEVAAAKQALATLEAQAQARAKDIAAVEQAITEAREYARRLEVAAREFGVYVEFLSKPGARIEDLPMGTAMALAGVILFTGIQQHGREPNGDPVLQLQPSLQAGRPFPVTVKVSELPGLFAPPSTYGALMRATEERAAMARAMVAAPAEGEGGEG